MTKILLALLGLLGVSADAQSRLPNSPRQASCSANLDVPAGFCVTVFAENVGGARHLVVAPNGDVFVKVEGGGGRLPAGAQSGGVVALRDTNGDGVADVRQQFGSGAGSGIALQDVWLYATSNGAIVRYRLPPRSLTPPGRPDTIVSGFPLSGSHHAVNFVVVGGSLFVNIGSASNACQQRDGQLESSGYDPCTELETRAGIWEFDANRVHQRVTDGRRYATGLRNSVALARNPLDGSLYAVVHGRDELHDNWPSLFSAEKSAENPGEEFVRVDRGSDYGWPYCYYDVDRKSLLLAPEYGGDGRTSGRCPGKTPPLMAFPGHWAPNGLLFYTGGQFPAQYRGGAFVAFHGSWNRAPLPQAGFRVAFAPFRFNRPLGTFTTFADGFAPSPGTGRVRQGTHRPVGLAQGPDGSLYISDDTGGTIWKVTYRTPRR